MNKATTPLLVLCLGLIVIGAYLWQSYMTLFNDSLAERAKLTARLSGNEQLLIELRDELTESYQQNTRLVDSLNIEQGKNSIFANQINGLTESVSSLDKLTKLDPELLQKYSKVYFLNENYVPDDLLTVPSAYIVDKDKPEQIHAKVLPYLKKMLKAARDDGLDLLTVSVYRSFDRQSELKHAYNVTYGAGTANQFSAEQGYSEHQLGTAIDFTTRELGVDFDNFDGTDAYPWLERNAYRFGFILSYPEGNSYYQFEPWHWRFVGVALATELHTRGEYFYNADQRWIDRHLISIFD